MNTGLLVGHRRPPTPASDLDRVANALDVLSGAGRDVTAERREESYLRTLVQTANTLSNQVLRLTYETARRSGLVRSIKTNCTVAQTGSSPLCRIGVYLVDPVDNLTLIAASANDSTLWSVIQTYTKALAAPFMKQAGQRYAVGFLYVGGGTAPQLGGLNMSLSDIAADTPKLSGAISSQADLPATIAAGSTGTTGNAPFFEFVP